MKANRVAAVQMPFAWAESPQEYFDRVNLLVAEAARCGAELLVFPAHTGDMLAGMQIPAAPPSFVGDHGSWGPFASWSECVRQTASTTAQFFVHTFETLASRYQLYLLPGTLCLSASQPDGLVRNTDTVYRAAFLFGPDGQVLAEQRQLHPHTDANDRMGAGESVVVTETPFGRITILIAEDSQEREIYHLVTGRSTDLLLCVGAVPVAAVDPARKALRLLSEMGRLFIVDAQLSGVEYAGLSAVLAPVALTLADDGVLAQASAIGATEVVCADLDWERLRSTPAASQKLS
jgi:predicted amidohydrolase